MKKQKIIDLALSFLATVAAFFLSWPFWRDHEYWAESPQMWWVYFILGSVMTFYVFYIFIDCLRVLFLHDELLRKGIIGPKAEKKEKGEEK